VEVADAGRIGFGCKMMQGFLNVHEQTQSQNRLSFIFERAHKVTKDSLMLKINQLEKRQTTPLKFDLEGGSQVKTTRPDPKP